MASARPELIFITGPQDGQRAVLMKDTAVIGRSPAAEIVIEERYVSRKHARLQLTSDGWVFENLSPSGTRINGKKFKKDKKVILDTGDVLHVGKETRVLFVAPGDDPEAALTRCRSEYPELFAEPQPQGEPAEKAAEEPQTTDRQGEPATESLPEEHEAEPSEKPPTPVELEEEKAESYDPAAEARKAKIKKYAIAFGVYLLVIAVGIILLVHLSSGEKNGRNLSQLTELTGDEIAEAITAPYERQRYPNKAAQELKKALSSYELRTIKPGERYQCVRSFKLYLAYKNGSDFDDPQHGLMFQRVTYALIKEVKTDYQGAYAYMKAKNWPRAKAIYKNLLRILPERDPKDPVYEKIIKNVLRHSTYASNQLAETRKK